MPFGVKPECIQCQRTESAMWRNTELGFICNECSQKHKEEEKQLILSQQKEENLSNKNQNSDSSSTSKIMLRKSTRMTRNYKTRLNPYALPKPLAPKGKGRRNIFKKMPMKAPSAVATTVTSNYIFYKGSYMQVGDVVQVEDINGGIFYAQIRGLMTDAYGEKSAVISWLVPTRNTDSLNFDPSVYILGPDEDLPRKLECLKFIMHAPSDYFKSRNTPYPQIFQQADKYHSGYVWTRLGVGC
ncbi:hypothetical protein RUM43_014201 [Polyplax serrata]|uniref:GATA zinc finger domain-containing protein 1 n=1 Tax=Polyplax serrata TaxID=468196 RepID=A0AAN8NWX6_POLSC